MGPDRRWRARPVVAASWHVAQPSCDVTDHVTSATRERVVYLVAAVVVVLAAFGALVTGEDLRDLELTLIMLAAVVAGLVCFDTAMEHRLSSFAPWLLLSLAPAAKTVPTVWQELRAESGASFERYDHAGSLLFALLVLAAVTILARPSAALGAAVGLFDRLVIFASAIVAALAGASVAFLFDRDFGSVAAGRILETPTWFCIGGILAAVVVAASRSHSLPPALMGVLATAGASVVLLATSVAGTDADRGWWAVVFAGLTLSAALTSGKLGSVEDRMRPTNAPVAVALATGVVAATTAIAARSDSTSWGPGWAVLGLVSLATFALAMLSKPIAEQRQAVAAARLADPGSLPDIGLPDGPRAARAKARAMARLQEAPVERSTLEPVQRDASAAPGPPLAPTASSGGDRDVTPGATVPIAADPAPAAQSPGASAVTAQAPTPQPATPAPQPMAPQPAAPAPQTVAPQPAAPAPQTVAPQPAAPAPQPVAPQPTAPAPQPVTHSPPASPAPAQPATSTVPLSGAGIVASAQAAAAVRTARSADRHSLAPLDQAHHFDPSTGLLSAAGLQHALARAFDVPRRAAHVSIMMFMIRDLDTIERTHGRLASAAVTREVAERVRTLLPDGTGARFARSAYAVVFIGDMSDSTATVQRLARTLLDLRAPVEGGSLGDKIDVVAGMAQCYEREDAAQFIQRANAGLARAVQSPEPTFVAMP